MYVPRSNAVDDDARIREFVRTAGAADLVSVGSDGVPMATLLPIVWNGSRIVAHLARANPHWSHLRDGDRVLLIVNGPQAYVTPTWYPAKQEHGRVVPTWNYTSVHLTGTVRILEDDADVREAVRLLTELHESPRTDPWDLDDPPPGFIDGMLRAIVGVEITVERVEAKAKLSQNRSDADRAGVIAGLRGEDDVRGEHRVAALMDEA